MDKIPNSYKSPFWQSAAEEAEREVGLPDGLLKNILLHGERSNNDQVSEAGARTPFQIIPATRNAIIKKYGVDAYDSPANAAKAAALLLKESLDRNSGDIRSAVAEYHGGTDRRNWGPRTKAYIQRIDKAMGLGDGDQQQQPQSTFQRVQAQLKTLAPESIKNIYDAYQNGLMSDAEAADFESDVKSGAIMLPRGMSIGKAEVAAPRNTVAAPQELPIGVVQAYRNGLMSPQEVADLEADIAAGRVSLPDRRAQIPGALDKTAPKGGTSFIDDIVGTGESALSLASGAIGGTLGMVGGTLGGIAGALATGELGTQSAKRRIDELAAQGAQSMTYAPRTQAGQEQMQALGGVLANVPAFIPVVAPAGVGTQAAKAVAQQVPLAMAGAGQASVVARQQAGATAQKLAAARQQAATPAGVPPMGRAAGGAEATNLELQRQAEAEMAGLKLTEGEIKRDAPLKSWEHEMARTPEFQAPFLARQQQNNVAALAKLEQVIDDTGAETGNLSDTGIKVVDTLMAGWSAEKAKTRELYDYFRKSPEAKELVFPSSVIDFINDQPIGVSGVTGVTDTARQNARILGIATINKKTGKLVVNNRVTLGELEDFRQSISKIDTPSAGYRMQAAIIKKLIDEAGKAVGGDLTKAMRAQRRNQANKYENKAIVARLLLEKKGMADPQTPIEDVFKKTILSARPSEIRHIKRVLLSMGGEDGKQAWNELKGATVRHIQENSVSGIGADNMDVISAAKMNRAIKALDQNGKLDEVLGKPLAEQVRNLNQVLQYIQTAPPLTSINNSGTARTIMSLMAESAAMGAATGIPLPVLQGVRAIRGEIKDRKIKSRIDAALNYKPENK